MTKYIFITGGVVSSLGKGITMASIGALLKAFGYNHIKMIKLDPYLNIDPGTMNPFEHGEVFVTKDGKETDLDLGHYERFTEIETNANCNTTSGKLYYDLLEKERRGEFLGKTVQITPHLTDSIQNFIKKDSENYDFVLIEIGGTIGDLEAAPFMEAIRQMIYEVGKENAINIHITLIPYISAAKELKSKPTQKSVKELMSLGIVPDIIVCRSERKIREDILKKICRYCNVEKNSVIEAIDVKNIYEVPIRYFKQGIIDVILNKFKMKCDNSVGSEGMIKWNELKNKIGKTNGIIKVGIVGKYVPYDDAYISLVEALKHSAWNLGKKIDIVWINSRETVEYDQMINLINEVDCIVVPGGFGKDGLEMKLMALKICREKSVPTLGICLGMQMMILEYIRNVVGIKSTTEEIGGEGEIVVGYMKKWFNEKGDVVERSECDELGGTMRLGDHLSILEEGSVVYDLYGKEKQIVERHRHRYEVCIDEKLLGDLKVVGRSVDGLIPEIVELGGDNFYVGCQFHPEYKSTPFRSRPLFDGLLKSCSLKEI